jgi:peptide/nickel transport system substrate-binding protein
MLAMAALLCFAITSVFAGAGADSSNAQAAKEKVITVAQSSEVANLNPMLFPRTPDSTVQRMMFDPLVGPMEDLSFTGRLAESWTVSPDGKVYTFKLRQGVKWHDGQPFTSKDVAFTLNSLANPAYTGGNETRVSSIVGSDEVKAGQGTAISGIKVIDDYNISFTLKSADASFLSQLYLDILPEHILGKVSPADWQKHDFNRNPIGTGKYKFVRWQSGQYIEMVKNTDYFGKQPTIDRLFVRFGDLNTMIAALMNGEVDVVDSIGASEIETLNNSSIASAVTYPTMNMYYIGLNLLNDHLKDHRVREALSRGLDKERIIYTVYGEFATPTDDLFPDTHWSHSNTVTVYPYDPAMAEQLLQQAGYAKNANGIYAKNGSPLHFVYDMVSGKQEADNMAMLVQQYWKAIGVDMEIRTQDFSTLAFTRLLPNDSTGTPRAVRASDFDMYTLGFGVETDPDEYRTYFVSQYAPPEGMNFVNYSNPQVDALFAESITKTSQTERMEVFHQIGKLLSDDIPWIPLYCNVGIVGVSNRVKNYKVDYRGITYQIAEWDVE